MNKEQYLAELETTKGIEKQCLDRRKALREAYIQANKPCNIGDMVEITLNSGRKAIGEAHEFGILQDKGVYITAYRDPANKTKLRYISAPHGEVKQINK
jgi:uncharacterized protein Veg